MMVRFLGSDIFRGSVYGQGHPLNIARVWPVIDICRALGWLAADEYQQIAPATPKELQLFHTPDYVAALLEAEKQQELSAAQMQRHRIGLDNNPIFPQVYSRPATAAAASMRGAKALLSGEAQIVFNPSGGTHHGMPDRANGFCFVNDPALAILSLLRGGAGRVAYIDIDAHHADGVEAHLSGLPQVRLWSVHEENRWPRTGKAGDVGQGNARNYTLARGAEDTALLKIINQHIVPEVSEFAPEFIILQAGCDGLADDPQSGLCYSNQGYWQAIEQILALKTPSMILGGGGYNPYSTARAWAGIWGLIKGKNPYQTKANADVQQILSSLEWQHRRAQNRPARWTEQLFDETG